MDGLKHTPGPWAIEGRRGPGFIISHGVCAEGDGPEGYVGVLDPMFHIAGQPSALEANARLIAAAPDLLAALTDAAMNLDACAVAIQKGGRSQGRHALVETWAKRARAAIAKAESDQ